MMYDTDQCRTHLNSLWFVCVWCVCVGVFVFQYGALCGLFMYHVSTQCIDECMINVYSETLLERERTTQAHFLTIAEFSLFPNDKFTKGNKGK